MLRLLPFIFAILWLASMSHVRAQAAECGAGSRANLHGEREQTAQRLALNERRDREQSLLAPAAVTAVSYAAALGLGLGAIGVDGREPARTALWSAAALPLSAGIASSVWLHRRSTAHIELARERRALLRRMRFLDARILTLDDSNCERTPDTATQQALELSELDARLTDLRTERERFALGLPIALLAAGGAAAAGMGAATLLTRWVLLSEEESEGDGRLSEQEHRQVHRMAFSAFAGLGVAAAGAGLLAFRLRQRKAMRADHKGLLERRRVLELGFAPAIGSNLAGLTVQGRF